MTNIYPDHLNTYNGMEDYAEAKANIFRHQHAEDIAVFNYDNPWTRRFGEEAPGQTWFTSLQRGGSFVRGSESIAPFQFTQTPLAGQHNLENILLATTTARLLGVADDIIAETVRRFHGVPHRLEDVASLTVCATSMIVPALPRLPDRLLGGFPAPIVLVAGGNTKHLPLERWPGRIVERCRAVVLLSGSGTDELLPAIHAKLHVRVLPIP